MSAISFLTDGDYAARLLLAPTRITRPFLNYPAKDSATKVFERWYEIDRASYTPFAAGATLPNDGTADPADSAAYILEESEPDLEPDGTQRVRCVFGHIPPRQEVVTSVRLTKPALEGTFPQVYGAYRIFQPDTSLLRYDAYTAQTVAGDTGAPGFYPTGGTYTITFAGATTGSLNYNDSAGTVQTALNALTPISNRGGVTVTGSYNSAGGFVITFAAYSQITLATGSLTGGTINKTESLSLGGYAQIVSAYIIRSVVAVNPASGSLTKNDPGAFTTTDFDYYDGGGVKQGRGFTIEVADGYLITGGTYTLTVSGLTTAAIAYNATAATIAAALTALGLGSFTVQGLQSDRPAGLTAEGNAITGLVVFDPSGPTGGTFTLTVGADTTAAIAYNATAAAVETALELLTSVSNRGGCSVSGSLASGFTITFANSAMTAASGSLTPSGSLATPSVTDSGPGRTHKIVFSNPSSFRDLYIPAHGLATGQTLYLKLASGATFYAGITNYSVPDANTIRLALTPADAYAAASTIAECGKRTKQAYTPGVATVPGRRITDYYYPGISVGITTDDDIPIPINQSDGVPFLEAVFGGSATINWEVGDLEIYRGPVRRLTTVTIAAADV